MEKTKKMAFICPLDEPETDVRKRSDDIMDGILQPIAEELNYSIQRADILHGKYIMLDIIDMLYNADIVIADLSDLNVNVFYELGLYHAIKGKFVTIMQSKDKGKIPFDAKYFRVHWYPYPFTASETRKFQKEMKESILDLENKKYAPCFVYKPEEITKLFNITVVAKYITSKKAHYALAKDLFSRKCKNIFLMQRSSSLVLGPEGGWDEEGEFFQHLLNSLNTCDTFYHIITLEGIKAHINRKDSTFPNFKNYENYLANKDGIVAVKINKNDGETKDFYLKKLPEDESDPFFKLDRQARVLVVEYEDNTVKAVIVQNLGSDQICFLLEGNEMEKYLKSCIDYYHNYKVHYVTWSEVEDLYEEYEKINTSRLNKTK